MRAWGFATALGGDRPVSRTADRPCRSSTSAGAHEAPSRECGGASDIVRGFVSPSVVRGRWLVAPWPGQRRPNLANISPRSLGPRLRPISGSSRGYVWLRARIRARPPGGTPPILPKSARIPAEYYSREYSPGSGAVPGPDPVAAALTPSAGTERRPRAAGRVNVDAPPSPRRDRRRLPGRHIDRPGCPLRGRQHPKVGRRIVSTAMGVQGSAGFRQTPPAAA